MQNGGNPPGPGVPHGVGKTQLMEEVPYGQQPQAPMQQAPFGQQPQAPMQQAPYGQQPQPPMQQAPYGQQSQAPMQQAPYGQQFQPPIHPGAFGVASAQVPPKGKPASNKLGAVLAIGGVVLVAILGVVGYSAYSAMQNLNHVKDQLAASQSTPAVANATPTGSCKSAYDCCVKITTAASDAVFGAQCEAFKTPGHTEAECGTALAGYARVAQTRNLACN